MGASLSRRGASPVEGAPEAPEATKRPRAASKEEVQFTRVLEHGHNVSAILAFAGYRNVLTLEALCPRARRLIRGARVELDVSNETNLVVAVKAAARAELFEARRSGASGAKTHYKFVFDDCRARASDIVYRDDRALLLSPRARAPALVEGFRGADVDAARSACAIAAKERRRAALLAIGYFEVELGSRDATGIAARESLFHRSAGLSSTEDADLAAPEAARLVDAMGGAVVIPRRLQLAAGRRQMSRQLQNNGTQAQLDQAMRQAARASAVLDEVGMRRLVAVLWTSMANHEWKPLPEDVFIEKVLRPAGIGAEAHVIWQELMSGILLPLEAIYKPHEAAGSREASDVRVNDVAHVTCVQFLWSAFYGFGISSLARDAATCFSPSRSIFPEISFEQFVIRQCDVVLTNDDGCWSMALAVLDSLGAERDGETSGEAGKQRVSEAIQSLLTQERVHTLAAGDEIDFAEGGDPDPPGLSPLAWLRGSVVSVDFKTKKAVVRVGEEEKEAFFGQLRLVEAKPCAAIVLLAHALADHQNDVALRILQSPLMKSPLSYIVGEPGKSIPVRTDARCTVLDHAIVSKNTVGIGLLWNAAGSPTSTEAWMAVRRASHCLKETKQPGFCSPAERADLFCALREGPGAVKCRWPSWAPFEGYPHWGPEEAADVETLEIIAACNGDLATIRKGLARCSSQSLKARLVSRPWQVLSSLWRPSSRTASTSDSDSDSDSDSETDPRDEAKTNYSQTCQVMIIYACKMGHDEVVAEVLRHSSSTVIPIWFPVLIAIAEGHQPCLEKLLSPGPNLDQFLSAFAPDAGQVKNLGHRAIMQSVDVGNAAAIEALRSRGVPFDKYNEDTLSPLELACRAGQAECVRALLRCPKVFETVSGGQSEAFHIAAHYGYVAALAVLFEHFSLTNAKVDSMYADSVLICAVASGEFAAVELVLKQPDVDVNAKPEGRMNAIMVAARSLNYNIFAALLARGACLGEPRVPNGNLDPLDYVVKACREPREKFVQKHVDAAKHLVRLIIQKRPEFAGSFLSYFITHYLHEDIVEVFLTCGADASQADSVGITALHMCAYYATVLSEEATENYRILQVAEVLILGGASVTVKTSAAATNNNFPVFDNYALDAGLSPLDVARHCGHPDRREAVTKAFEAAILKRDAAAGRTPNVEAAS